MRMLIALTALTTIIVAPSFAQTAASPGTTTHSAVMLAHHTMRASKLIGLAVYNDEGETVGKVDDIVVTAGAIEPTVVVLVAGGWLGGAEKLTTEPLSHLKLAPGDKMMMPGATKAAISARPPWTYSNGLNGGGG